LDSQTFTITGEQEMMTFAKSTWTPNCACATVARPCESSAW
jgi:hypothetical protein